MIEPQSNWYTLTQQQQQKIEQLRKAGIIDEDWYINAYPDVAMLGMDPVEHFLKYGPLLSRNPNSKLSTSFISDVVPKLTKAEGIHWVEGLLRNWQDNVDPRRVLWAADRLMCRGDFDRAITLAKQYLPPELATSLHILEANQAISNGDRTGWLDNINAYLVANGVAPVLVTTNSTNILENMGSEALSQVEYGPKVSVIIPAFNAEKTIDYAINSILNQTWTALEVIVIDDHSSDGTWVRIQDLAKSDSRLIVLRNPINVGPYVTKNVGLKIATGTYVTGHDADDWALPQRVQQQVEFILSNAFGFALSGMLRMQENGTVTRITRTGGPNTQDGACASAYISLMAETRLLKGIYGYWDELRFAGDSELIRRIETIENRKIPRLYQVGMFTLDNPDGLTNHSVFGYTPGKPSEVRAQNRDAAINWHSTLDRTNSYLSFPQKSRSYKALPESLNDKEAVSKIIDFYSEMNIHRFNPLEEVDVCIITSLNFSGGNCSSTLDEVRILTENDISLRLIHCPIDTDLLKDRAFNISPRYNNWEDKIKNWCDVGRVRCKHLIVRHPRVISSICFERIIDRISCNEAHIVINNSSRRINGKEAYQIDRVLRMTDAIMAQKVQILPISPVIREELNTLLPSSYLGKINWPPTFDVDDYHNAPKKTLSTPYRLGRHGRDGPEKWLENSDALLQAYPVGPDFEIEILGGADEAIKILSKLPSNWTVHEFGTITPLSYLESLDFFVYFPNNNLSEAFGRTIVEAMISSVPCILPHRFKETFSDLAFYVEPEYVSSLVRLLAENWEECCAFLACSKNIVITNFSSDAIGARFPDLPITRSSVSADENTHGNADFICLPPEHLNFKRRMESLATQKIVLAGTFG